MTASVRVVLCLASAGLALAGGLVAPWAGARQAAPAPTAVPSPVAPRAPAPPVSSARVIRSFPHDPAAFTQGLLFRDGKLYESTGLEGVSQIREVDLVTGTPRKAASLPANLFGEGIADWGDEIVSLTWRTGIGFRWDRRTLRRRAEFRYPGEGWGLTQDGRSLILSDGTAQLRFLDPATIAERRRLTVTFRGTPLTQLNELEWVDGEILANVWHQPAIVRIDPASGRVTGVIDLAPLMATMALAGPDAVANGIAWDRQRRRLYVTGKNWPRLFEIAWPPAPATSSGSAPPGR